MQQIVNKVFKPLFTTNKRYVINMGGRGAGRSTVASQYANSKLIAPEYFRCAIMRYVLGDIRNSIYREIIDRATENGVVDKLNINDSTMTISYGNNSINAVGFKKSSGEQKAKLKSLANYTDVIIEEADEISEEDFIQLDDSLRTLKGNIRVMLLLNAPPKSHWLIKRFFDLLPTEVPDFYLPVLKPEYEDDTLFVRALYTDNAKNLSEQTMLNYERYKTTKPTHYYNMIMGYIPETVTGKIYKNWQIIESVPFEARLVRRGLDFGYTNDPTAIVDVYQYNGGLILDLVCYKQGMSNRAIADTLKILEDVMVIADSAEPKSIDEIKGYDISIYPADKGQGSLNQGIAYVQDQKISVTARSKKLIEEYENYAWHVDKDGNVVNTPKPGMDHALDAARYAIVSIKPERPVVDVTNFIEDKPMYSDIGI